MTKRLFLALQLIFCLGLLSAQDYRFEQYHFDMQVALDNSYAVTEDITANFSSPRHGIYREIPIQFGPVRVKLKNLTSNEPIKQDSVSSDYITFRLGSADRTVIGKQQYLISYSYVIGDDRNAEYDELYYNLVGPGWQAPIDEFSFTISFPSKIDPSMVWMTGGYYGSTDQRGSFKVSSDGKTVTGIATGLQPGEALTLRVQLPQGYFSAVKPFVDYTIPASVFAVVVGLLAIAYSLSLFFKYGREDLFVPVVRFESPEELSPLEVGYLADGVVDNKDLTSLIFYWADQGALTIEELSKKDFKFTKLRDPVTIKRHELDLFNALFNCGDGNEVTLKDLEKGKFGLAMQKAKASVQSYFKGNRKLKESTAERKRVAIFLLAAVVVVFNGVASTINYLAEATVVFFGVGLVSTIMGSIIAARLTATWEMKGTFTKIIKIAALILFCIFALGFALLFEYAVVGNGPAYSLIMSFFMVVTPTILGFLGVVASKRSPYAQKMLEQIVGYREFISKVEMDKLKLLIDSDPQIFYHVLGYAIVLGLEDTWAKKFQSLSFEQPSWYYGRTPIADALFYSALSHRLHSTVMEKAVYSQARGGGRSPVHSSFGSGGFSGGGFGGGGGGAW